MDEDLYESIYAIRGTFKGTCFSVVYREYDELVLIKIENNLNAVLSHINVNQESMSSGGIKLTKNKTFLVPSKLMGRPDANESTTEWYPLYTISETADGTVIEMGYFLLLLFFAIGNAG